MDWIWMVAFVVGYVVLTQWLLPKLGIPTWRTNACAGSRRDDGTPGATSTGSAIPDKGTDPRHN